jgi:cell division protein FtsI/penicillin-binding protein 2
MTGQPKKTSHRTTPNRVLVLVVGFSILVAIGFVALQVGSWLGSTQVEEPELVQTTQSEYAYEPARGSGTVSTIADADAWCDETVQRWVAENATSQNGDAISRFLNDLPQGCIDRQQDAVARLRRSVSDDRQAEDDAYEAALREKRRDRYEDFLWRYPNSQYAATVRARLLSCRSIARADGSTGIEAQVETCD